MIIWPLLQHTMYNMILFIEMADAVDGPAASDVI